MDKMGSTFNKSKYIIDNFDRALAEGWVEVYFQPIIRTSNGRVCAEEALVRWEDPQLGILNPIDFVPALEAVNAVYKLDLYVLEITLAKMNEQIRRGLYVVPTSINLSQVDFYTCDVVEEITKRVEKANISRRLITIEVSEQTLSVGNKPQGGNMENENLAVRKYRKQRGVMPSVKRIPTVASENPELTNYLYFTYTHTPAFGNPEGEKYTAAHDINYYNNEKWSTI